MYLTTDQLRNRLASIHPTIEQYWPSLGILIDEAYAAGRRDGVEDGRTAQVIDNLTGRRQTSADNYEDLEADHTGEVL